MISNLDDFTVRCLALNGKLSRLRSAEKSDRVWMTAMLDMIVDIINNCENPEKAIEQLILSLRKNIVFKREEIQGFQQEGNERD